MPAKDFYWCFDDITRCLRFRSDCLTAEIMCIGPLLGEQAANSTQQSRMNNHVVTTGVRWEHDPVDSGYPKTWRQLIQDKLPDNSILGSWRDNEVVNMEF